ncbi:unnamed protein product, partial [Amoebophrya sp. A120]
EEERKKEEGNPLPKVGSEGSRKARTAVEGAGKSRLVLLVYKFRRGAEPKELGETCRSQELLAQKKEKNRETGASGSLLFFGRSRRSGRCRRRSRARAGFA